MAERDDDGFLARWSRRKRGESAPGAADTGTAGATPESAARKPGDSGDADHSGDPQVIAALPDIDSLDETSDFSAFLQEGVPDALRRQALRRLWRLNPVLANLDGLNDYDDDFSAIGIVAEHLRTIYKAGKGYLDEAENEAERGTDAEVGTGADAERDPGPAESAPSSALPGSERPADIAQVSRSEPEPAPCSPRAGDAAPESKKPPRGSALARRWGASPDKG